MKRAGYINVKVQKSSDYPGYSRQQLGFVRKPSSGSTGDGGDGQFEPFFGYIAVRDNGKWDANTIVQCVIYVFRPGGIVQILLNENAAATGTRIYSFGPAGPNLIAAAGVNNPPNNANSRIFIRVPEAPGIYAPDYSVTYTTTARLPRSGARIAPALVRNDLTAGYQPGSTYSATYYRTLAGLRTTNFFQTSYRGLSSIPRSAYCVSNEPSWSGAQYVANSYDRATGINYMFQNSARPRFAPWTALIGGSPTESYTVSVVLEDDPDLNALLGVTDRSQVYSWDGGTLISIGRPGTDVTNGIVLIDPAMEKYWVLNIIPGDAFTTAGLAATATSIRNINIDKYGILWMHLAGAPSPYNESIITSFEPIGWDIPQIQYVPRAALNLGCMQTCFPTNPY